MAFTKKSWQDHLTASFGQESETARASKDGLVVGGVYNATPPTIADGEFSRLQVTAAGALAVDLVSGDAVTVSVGTITTGSLSNIAMVHAGTIGVVSSVSNVAAGTLTVVSDLSNVSAGTISVVEDGTISAVTDVSNLSAGTLTVVSDVTNVSAGTLSVVEDGTVSAIPINSMSEFTGTITIPSSDTVTTGTLANATNGILKHITLVTPDMEDTDSVNLRLQDASAASIYTAGTQAESSTVALGTLTLPLTNTMEWVATAEGTQSAGRNVVITTYYSN